MYLISNQAWQEAIDLLEMYKSTAHDRANTREVNSRRRAGLLINKLKKSQKINKTK